MIEYKVRIKGTADYLQNRLVFDEEEQTIKKRVGKKDYKDEWKDKVYSDEEGCYIPSKHIEGALVKSAVNFPIPGKGGKKTYKDIFKGLVFVKELNVRFIPEKKEIDPEKDLYKDIVVINRRRVITTRPMYHKGWEAEFTIISLEGSVTKELLEAVLETAGIYAGIGDYRPKFGRFEVLEIS